MLESCVIAGNHANAEGGGINGTNCTITNCTIAGNDCGGNGGGGGCLGIGIHFLRTILWGNCAAQGPDGLGSDMTFTCCALDQTKVIGYSLNGPQVETDPLFCAPESCAGNPTTAGNYLLDVTSPCLPLASPCHELIGAFGQGCGGTPVRQVTWGRIRASFR
jgi:hypothetical protein